MAPKYSTKIDKDTPIESIECVETMLALSRQSTAGSESSLESGEIRVKKEESLESGEIRAEDVLEPGELAQLAKEKKKKDPEALAAVGKELAYSQKLLVAAYKELKLRGASDLGTEHVILGHASKARIRQFISELEDETAVRRRGGRVCLILYRILTSEWLLTGYFLVLCSDRQGG